jgi:plastocyanin
MSTRRKTLVAAIMVPVAVLLSFFAVNAATAGTSHAQAAHQAHSQIATPTITISMFAFHTPATVLHGALIHVVNKDSVAHTVTSNVAGKFNVSVPAHSTRSFHAPATKGTYGFKCTIHPSMKGTLHVH